MKLARRVAGALFLGVLVIGTACSDLGTPTSPESNPGIAPLQSRTAGIGPREAVKRLSPVTGAGSAVATIGPEGGTIRVRDVEVMIPPGALTKKTRIHVIVPGGPIVRAKFQPEGLQFQKPVRIGFDLSNTTAAGETDLFGAYFSGNVNGDAIDPVELFEATIVGGQLQFWTDHFSDYAPVYGRPPETGRGGGHTPAGG